MWSRSVGHGLLNIVHRTSVLLVGLIVVILLTSCGASQTSPTYPDILSTLDAHQASTLGNAPPHFGAQLSTASGTYYLAQGSLDTVERWYDRQVAEQVVVYVDEYREATSQHRLYRIGGISGPISEIALTPVSTDRTLIAIYDSLSISDSYDSNGSWFRRIWGFLLGYTGPSLVDVAFTFVLQVLTPVRSFYETIWLRPTLNVLVILRWVFGWNYGILVMCFSIIAIPFTSLLETITSFVTKRTIGRLTSNPYIPGFAYAIIVFILTNLLLSTALWESMNGFYDVSPSGQSWLQSRLYPFWSQGTRVFVENPPSALFLGSALIRPSIFIVPTLVFIAGFISFMLQMASLETQSDILKDVEPEKAEQIRDYLDFATNNFGELVKPVIREAAILAFIPLGVSLYFIADKVIGLYDTVLELWDLSAVAKAYKTHSPHKEPSKFIRRLVLLSMVLLLMAWLVFADKGTIGGRLITLITDPQPSTVVTQPTAIVTVISASVTAIPTPPSAMTIPTGTVIADILRVRADTSPKSQILGRLSKGETIELRGRTDDHQWLNINYNGQQAWVSAEWIDAAIPIENLPVVSP